MDYVSGFAYCMRACACMGTCMHAAFVTGYGVRVQAVNGLGVNVHVRGYCASQI